MMTAIILGMIAGAAVAAGVILCIPPYQKRSKMKERLGALLLILGLLILIVGPFL